MELAEFRFDGDRVPLIDRQRGIRKPAALDSALSIRTAYTPVGQRPPYEDTEGPDGLLRYKYRGNDPLHPDNAALRSAYQSNAPLIWFIGVGAGMYLPIYPIWIIGDDPGKFEFVLALDSAQRLVPVGAPADDDRRAYVELLTKARLHQQLFRAEVLEAYQHRCAMCLLRYPLLIDAAHILPDGHPSGTPVVPNGVALCKIHHAAYDQNILGVRPDLVIEVRNDVRTDSDGSMLLHGLQEMGGVRLSVPHARRARPDPSRLELRYQEFLKAG